MCEAASAGTVVVENIGGRSSGLCIQFANIPEIDAVTAACDWGCHASRVAASCRTIGVQAAAKKMSRTKLSMGIVGKGKFVYSAFIGFIVKL